MNIIGTIKFFFRKFLKEDDKKHQSIMQIEKSARVFAVQKSSAKLLTSKSLSKQLWIVSKKSLSTKLSTDLLITFFFLFPHFLSAQIKTPWLGRHGEKKYVIGSIYIHHWGMVICFLIIRGSWLIDFHHSIYVLIVPITYKKSMYFR